jgi:hypothetical protein
MGEFMGLPVDGGVNADVFADEAMVFDVINGTVRITFGVCREAEPGIGGGRVFSTVGRLVMPAGGAQKLALGLYDFLKKAGLDPSALASEGQTAQ